MAARKGGEGVFLCEGKQVTRNVGKALCYIGRDRLSACGLFEIVTRARPCRNGASSAVAKRKIAMPWPVARAPENAPLLRHFDLKAGTHEPAGARAGHAEVMPRAFEIAREAKLPANDDERLLETCRLAARNEVSWGNNEGGNLSSASASEPGKEERVNGKSAFPAAAGMRRRAEAAARRREEKQAVIRRAGEHGAPQRRRQPQRHGDRRREITMPTA